MYNPHIEQMEKSEMESIQLDRLRTTVEKVYNNVEFYRGKFNELESHQKIFKVWKILQSYRLQKKTT